MSNLEGGLAAALSDLGRQAPHQVDLTDRVRRTVRHRRIVLGGPLVVVIAVLVVLGSIWIGQPARTAPAAPTPLSCPPLQTTPPPQWARAGFSGNSFPPFSYTASGQMVAFVFADPLVSPPAAGRNNKILWVGKGPGAAGGFTIAGHLEGSDRTMNLYAAATPGPSTIDVPAPGCWHLDLSWGTIKDSINLQWNAD